MRMFFASSSKRYPWTVRSVPSGRVMTSAPAWTFSSSPSSNVSRMACHRFWASFSEMSNERATSRRKRVSSGLDPPDITLTAAAKSKAVRRCSASSSEAQSARRAARLLFASIARIHFTILSRKAADTSRWSQFAKFWPSMSSSLSSISPSEAATSTPTSKVA